MTLQQKMKYFQTERILWDLRATILYLSCTKTGENITQDNIANAGGVTGVTLRNRLKDLRINQSNSNVL